MKPQKICLLALILALMTLAGHAGAGGALAADHPLLKMLASVSVERGREFRALLVVPIARDMDDPADVQRPATAAEAIGSEDLSLAEPEKRPGRGPIDAFNWATRPILMLAGEVLEGGRRDRFLTRDVLIGGGTQVVVPAYPADRRARAEDDEKKTFKPIGAVAPDLLRILGISEGPVAAVSSFLEDEYALAGVQNPRDSLVGLFTAERLKARMDDYEKMFSGIPNESGKRIVGAAILVGDRLTGVDLFASNASFRAHWPTIFRTAAFQATLYEVSYGLLKHPFADGRDPDRQNVGLKALLKKPFAARASEEKTVGIGTEIRLARDELLGRAIVHEDQLIHAVLVLDFLNNRPPDATPPNADGTEPDEPTIGGLERRAGRSRLTEYEKRLLERMRQRRQGTPERIPAPRTGGTPGGLGGED